MRPAKKKNEFSDIDVNELGCMGEQEIAPGVKEETGFVSKKQVAVKLCFSHIPEQNRKAYWQLYEQFDNKDMSFEEFALEMHAINSPTLMQKDLEKIIDQKHRGNARQAGIDHAIKKKIMMN